MKQHEPSDACQHRNFEVPPDPGVGTPLPFRAAVSSRWIRSQLLGAVAAIAMGAGAFGAPQARPFTGPLPASTPSDRARAGSSVAVGQRVAIVGAPGDSLRGPEAGSVLVYDRDAITGAYVLGQVLMPPGVGPFDRFGASVSLSGNLLVVGAKGDDDAAPNAGAAYVFRRPGADQSFSFIQKLTPLAGGISDCFGVSVCALGNRIAIGAPRADSGAFDAGAAYVYTYDYVNDAVTLDAVVTRPGALAGESFGTSVAVFSDLLVVGTPRLDSPQGPANVGGVVVLEDDGSGNWVTVQTLFPTLLVSNAGFGSTLAMEPPRPGITGTLAVGAPDAGLPGENVSRGSVSVFQRSDVTAWQEVYTHGPAGVARGAGLGASLALQGDTILAGAPGRDYSTGGADALTRHGGTWGFSGELTIPGGANGDFAGAGVGFANQFPVIGAPGREISGQDSAGWAWSSAALWAPIGDAFCAPGNPNSTGLAAALSARGSTVALDQDFTLEAGYLPPGAFGFGLLSRFAAVTPAPGGSDGNLCLGGSIGRFNQNIGQADGGGRMTIELDLLDLPSPLAPAVIAGDVWWFQIWFRDSNPAPTSNFTHAIGVTFD